MRPADAPTPTSAQCEPSSTQATPAKFPSVMATFRDLAADSLPGSRCEARPPTRPARATTECCGGAGINRHGEGDERALHRRSSDPRWPRAVRWRPRGRRRSVGRGTRRLGYRAPKLVQLRCRRSRSRRKATPRAAFCEPLADLAGSKNLCMRGVSMRENREIPRSSACLDG